MHHGQGGLFSGHDLNYNIDQNENIIKITHFDATFDFFGALELCFDNCFCILNYPSNYHFQEFANQNEHLVENKQKHLSICKLQKKK